MTNNQENQEYDVCFEKDGVTFRGVFARVSKRVIIITYIDVQPGVDTVYFDCVWPEHKYWISEIEVLPNNKKSFPQVKTLHIGMRVTKINISNQMFPNIESVISDNTLFETRDMLVVSDGVLLNSFCKNDTDVLNMHGITCIGPFALSGCRTKNVINTNDIAICYKQSFDNYEPFIDPKTGIKLFENIVVEIDSKTKILEFPDDRYNLKILHNLNHSDFNKSVKIHRLQTLRELIDNYLLMPSHLIIDLKNNVEDENCLFNLIEVLNSSYVKDVFSEIEILNSNYFKSEDGIIYTADGEILLYCPRQKEGNVKVKKGTQIIASKAFLACKKIESVVLPDTIVAINNCAFMNCQSLKTINLSEGIKTIGDSCFALCSKLSEIEIPASVSIVPASCFSGCPLKSIKLNEGVTGINNHAFNIAECDLTVPESLMYVNEGNFLHLKSVTLKRNRLPLGLLSQILKSYFEDIHNPTVLTKVRYKNDVFYLPHIHLKRPDYATKSIELQPVDVIKNNVDVFLQYIPSKIDKVMIGLEIYEMTNDMNIERILKENSEWFLINQIKNKQEKTVIRFIKTGIVQPSILRMALKMTENENMTTASAYILDALKNQTDTLDFDI